MEGLDTFGLYAFGQKQGATRSVRARPHWSVDSRDVDGGLFPPRAGYIKPHVGYDVFPLRPAPAPRAGDESGLRAARRGDAPGRTATLIFCDAVEHEAWNRGTTTRTVLLVDLQEPALQVPAPNCVECGVRGVRRKRALADMPWRERMMWRSVEARPARPHAAAGRRPLGQRDLTAHPSAFVLRQMRRAASEAENRVEATEPHARQVVA